MIIAILPWTNGIMIKTGDWVKTREKKYRKRKTNKKQGSEFELPPLLETSSQSEESDNNI